MATPWGWRHLWAALGIALLAAWSPFYFAIGLVAPGWVSVIAFVLWLAFVGIGAWWFRPHPYRTLAVGVGAIVLWFAAVYLFDYVFGWTA